MAKHGVLPLSALVDFYTLWTAAPESERGVIVERARAARLVGCVEWAVRQTNMLVSAAEGRPGALEELGFDRDGRVFRHAYLRLMRLADRPIDAARVAAAWVWPRSSRASWRNLGTVWRRRLRKSRGEVGSFRQRYVVS
jgi:hypothetical protein